LIAGAATETSGSGPRPFDADRALTVPLYLLDITRPFEHWSVLARTGGADSISFRDLGVADDREQLVFEFWTRSLKGAFTGGFVPGPVDRRFGVQVFCIRERLPRPQLVATSRHVSCGGPDLAEVSWDGGNLVGRSELTGGDPYDIYVTEPGTWRLAGATATGARVVGQRRVSGMTVVSLQTDQTGKATWRLRFEKLVGR
jgi:hypothetical protein